MSGISVRLYEPKLKLEWQNFLRNSANGSLFQDRDFLDYHPPERFDQHSLVFYDESGQVKALFPAQMLAGSDSKKTLQSPFGASVGGLVVAPGISTETMLLLTRSLQAHATNKGFSEIEIRLSPSAFQHIPDEVQPFALACCGFRPSKFSLCYAVPLDFQGRDELLARFSKSKRYDVRKAEEKGVAVIEGGAEKLDEFHRIMDATYARHESEPTHEKAELEEIFRRVPGRVRLFLAEHSGRAVAGILVFVLNDAVATAFYICENQEDRDLCAPAATVAFVMEKLRTEGFRMLDLGPSASESHLNAGVVFFKEGLGARGFMRQTWSWRVQ